MDDISIPLRTMETIGTHLLLRRKGLNYLIKRCYFIKTHLCIIYTYAHIREIYTKV